MQVGVFRRWPKEEAELYDRRRCGDAPCLDGKTDETVDSAVTALECVRVLLSRRQLFEEPGVSVARDRANSQTGLRTK